MASLKGKTAIVTGASSGIGRGIAKELARAGAVTILAARSADKLDAVAKEIANDGGTAHVIATDMTKELWRLDLGGWVHAAPITYMVDDKQYVTIAAGNAFFTFGL